MIEHDGGRTDILLQCLGQDDGKDDDKNHSRDYTNNDHLLQRGRDGDKRRTVLMTVRMSSDTNPQTKHQLKLQLTASTALFVQQ